MERRENPPNQLQSDFIKKGVLLAVETEHSLGIKYAGLVRPEFLALIGACVYAPNEISISSPDAESFVSENIKEFPDSLIQDVGCSRTELQQSHLKLVGYSPETKEAIFPDGELASALRGAKEKVGVKKAEILERKYANIMAYALMLNPRTLNDLSNPGIRVDMSNPNTDTVPLLSDGLPFVQIKRPNIVVEYGPGIVAFKKIPSEVKATPQTFFIEKRLYACELLTTGANLYGIQTENRPDSPPQLVNTREGIKTTTQNLLKIGAENNIDLIIASGVQTAGREEITEGIINGHKLLRKGGAFAIRTIEENIYGISGKETFDLLKKTFGKDPTANKPTTTVNRSTEKVNPAFCAVFTK